MAYTAINTYDYNPAHALWYIMETMVGFPASWLHDASFLSAAATLHAEGRGISMLFDKAQSALAYIATILEHINGILYYGNDRKFHLKLVRDDYVIASLPVVDESQFLEPPDVRRGSFIGTYNEIKAAYGERFFINDPPEFISGDDDDTGRLPPLGGTTVDVYFFSAPEGTKSGEVIGTAPAYDADGDTLTYSIESGNVAGLFAINSGTGAISVTENISEAAYYQLRIKVVDGQGGQDLATVDINTPPDESFI